MAKLDLKLYRGYVNNERLVVFGHVFKSWAPDKYELDRRGIRHAFTMLQMFRIRPLKNQEITLHFKGLEITTKTLSDGFFKFDIPFNVPLKSGWHEYEVICKVNEFGMIGKGEVIKPFESRYGIISDIDDTFLVSHSNKFFKKLYIMLFKNVNKRKIFLDVTPHYLALSRYGQTKETAFNSFFYVSSSEWNLYDFIIEFTRLQELPKAVILLKDIKSGIWDFLKSGRGNHDHKFQKIMGLIAFYPNLEYVLLGDDSQQDAYIYERICKIYPLNIKAVYIRQTGNEKKTKVEKTLKNIETLDVATCYFKGSSTAIEHSRKIDII